jgi:hypothetical protein
VPDHTPRRTPACSNATCAARSSVSCTVHAHTPAPALQRLPPEPARSWARTPAPRATHAPACSASAPPTRAPHLLPRMPSRPAPAVACASVLRAASPHSPGARSAPPAAAPSRRSRLSLLPPAVGRAARSARPRAEPPGARSRAWACPRCAPLACAPTARLPSRAPPPPLAPPPGAGPNAPCRRLLQRSSRAAWRRKGVTGVGIRERKVPLPVEGGSQIEEEQREKKEWNSPRTYAQIQKITGTFL